MTETDDTIRVILADDHRIVAEAIRFILRDVFDVVDVVADGISLVAAVTRLRPHVVVTDLAMPGMDGLAAIRAIRRMDDPPGIVILSMHGNAELVAQAHAEGAGGYVLKEAAGSDLVAAILAVHAGQRYVTPLLRTSITQGSNGPRSAEADRNRLTVRQTQVLELTARGYRMKQIAQTLHISRRTVESHKYQMMSTLAARSTAELVGHAVRLGLVELRGADGSPLRGWPRRHRASVVSLDAYSGAAN